MRTDELRETLSRHADFEDAGLTARAEAVAGRVQVVRRRRRAGVAVVAAVVLAVVAITTALPGRAPGPQPADRTLIGIEAPAVLTSLGYTYAFAHGVEGEGTAAADLGRSDRPRLVSWATSGGGEVTVTPGNLRSHTSHVGDFSDFHLVPPGDAGRFKIAAEGRDVAVVVYTLTDDVPPGVTRDGITFREIIGSDRLLGATIGEPGASEMTVDVAQPPADEIRIRNLCVGAPRGVWFHLTLNGRSALMGSCDEDATAYDPGGQGSRFTTRIRSGTPFEARVWVTRGEDPEEVLADGEIPGLRLGAGFYAPDPDETQRLFGFTIDDVVEHDGHRWGDPEVTTASDGRPLVRELAGPDRYLVKAGVRSRGEGRAQIRLDVDGRQVDAMQLDGETRTMLGGVDGVGTVRVSATGPGAADAELGIVVYTRLD